MTIFLFALFILLCVYLIIWAKDYPEIFFWICITLYLDIGGFLTTYMGKNIAAGILRDAQRYP